jgi:hypothetical protein
MMVSFVCEPKRIRSTADASTSAKTKTELREMLAKAVRNTQPQPKLKPEPKLLPKAKKGGRWTVRF